MTKETSKYNNYWVTRFVLSCLLIVAGTDLYAHSCSNCFLPPDTIKQRQNIPVEQKPHKVRFTMASDSIDEANRNRVRGLSKPLNPKDSLRMDSLKLKKVFTPNPLKATWLAMVIPGGGQIYNRKFWKLPIVYGGLAGCAYALSWNNKMYRDYSQAYRDLMDNNPSTVSYKTLLPASSSYSTTQLSTILKNRKDLYRRYRDLSIFSLIAVYAISIIDAYVDAELSNFDISPDLSMRVQPVVMDNTTITQNKKTIGVQCSLRF